MRIKAIMLDVGPKLAMFAGLIASVLWIALLAWLVWEVVA